MAGLGRSPPQPDAIAAMLAIPDVAIVPSILATRSEQDAALGPEGAGAILVLQATFADPVGAEHFWAAAVPLMDLLAAARGFIRRYSFPDGPNMTLIAFWRTLADAPAFAAGPEHRAAPYKISTRSPGSTATSRPSGSSGRTTAAWSSVPTATG